MPHLEGRLRLSQERIASARESECAHDLTSGIHNFQQNQFEQTYVMKEEPQSHSQKILPLGFRPPLSAVTPREEQGRTKEGILLCIAHLGTFSFFLGGDPCLLRTNVIGSFGQEPILKPRVFHKLELWEKYSWRKAMSQMEACLEKVPNLLQFLFSH